MRRPLDEALVPGSDVLVESAWPREAQPRKQSSALAVVAKHGVLPSERSNQESLGTWEPFTWTSREKTISEHAEESAGHRWQMGESVDETAVSHVGECDASQWRSLWASQWRAAGSTAGARRSRERERERENLRQFGVSDRVPRHYAVGNKIGVECFDDYKRNVDESVFVRA